MTAKNQQQYYARSLRKDGTAYLGSREIPIRFLVLRRHGDARNAEESVARFYPALQSIELALPTATQ
jgi:hypothetical protein